MAGVAVAAKAIVGWVAGNAAATFVARALLSTAVSALSAHLQRQKARRNQPGIKTDYTTDGGTQPQKFVMGWYATDGHMVCPPMSHGKDNGYLTYVIDLGNVPGAQLESIIVDDEEVEFEAAPETGPIDGPVPPAGMPDWWYQQQGLNPLAPLFGLPATNLGRPALGDYKGKVWLRYYDGSQTAADPYLLQIYGPGTAWARRSERPWTAEMVGIGTSYAILTFKFDRDVFTGLPRCRFVMRGIPLYDPRRDASVGGGGSQRWDDPSTWAPTANGMVLAYNILRGIPIDGGPLWGYGVAAADLPLPDWTAAMTAADQIVDDAPRWQAGWEVAVDEEPADVLDEVLKVCCAKVAEVGGVWKPRVGPPAAPVLFIADDDLILDRDATLTPFPGLEATFNAIHASYPEPTALWRPKDAPPRYNEAWEAADQGRRLTAELNLPACPWEPQVQRVMRAYIEEERRFGRHVITLPPDAEALEPLDVIAWTSAENGYEAKLFEVHEITEDPDTLLVTLSLREVDPADYHWQPDYRLPSWVPPVTQPRPDPMVPEYFTAEGIAMADASGRGRQAAGRLRWGGWALDGITGVMWEIRRAGESDTLRGMMADPVAGETIAPGLAPSAGYEARIRFLAGGASAPMDWTAWTPFATPAIEITLEDVGGAPPTAPTGLALDSVPGTLTASWSAGTGAVAYYEIEITEGASAPLIFQTAGLRYEWTGIRPGRNFSARARAVDALGRKSPWVASDTHVSVGDTVPPTAPTGLVMTAGFNTIWAEWNRNTESDLDYYEVAAGTATNPTTIVARTPATSHALTELPDNATRYVRIRAVDTSGNFSPWTATVSKATVAFPEFEVPDNSITAGKLFAGEVVTLSAQIKDSIITNAKIVELSAAKLMAGTALASTITVNGTALGQMTDPAGLVNTGTTQIDPGKIRITGSTTLADWRKGGDETKIDGGAISANTIDSNKATIGMRGVTITGIQFEHNSPDINQVSWTAGSLRYVNDSNSPVAQAIAAGSATWTAGTLFIYWVKGASTFSTTTNLAVAMTANTVILASYAGGTNLNAEYGRTVIDEDGIKTGAVKAHHIEVEELSAVSGRMGVLDVNDRIEISNEGHLTLGKPTPYSETDGIFFGSYQNESAYGEKFAFSASRMDEGGVSQEIALTNEGFYLNNAQHYVTAPGVVTDFTVTATETPQPLPTGANFFKLTQALGGGGGGATKRGSDSHTAGQPGGDTTVNLYDGVVLKHSFTSKGGKAGAWGDRMAYDSVAGLAGRGHGADATGFGAGGAGSRSSGGPGPHNRGGAGASSPIASDWIDIRSWSNPQIEIIIGAGGAGGPEILTGTWAGKGGNGSPGRVQYQINTTGRQRADVVPIEPTAMGSFQKPSSQVTGSFPDLGAGLWVLHMGHSQLNIGLGYVSFIDGVILRIHETTNASFISSKTPTWASDGPTRVIQYLFYKMGSWA